MPRPPKPDFVVEWEQWVNAGPPQCCHTCENYDVRGYCSRYDMEPPAEWAALVGECEEWSQEVPF